MQLRVPASNLTKMPNKPQPPTPREIAVIRYGIAFGITSKTDLYQLAYDGSLRAWANLSDAPAQANRWFKSKRITTLYERESALYAQRQAKERARIEAEAIARHEANQGRTATPQQQGLIDYSQPENQRAKLNELVNTASDPGEALDALKGIIAGQRDDKQAAREQQTQRYYVPKSCEDCEIKAAFHKLTNNQTENK